MTFNPDDEYIISLSGGLASADCAFIAKEHNLKFRMVFADTSIEDEDLYRFVNDIEAKIGQEVIRLKDGRDPWDVYVDNKYIGNTRLAHCSQYLKTAQVKSWMAKNCNSNSSQLVLGIGLDEEDRIYRAQENWYPYKICSFLLNIRHEHGGPSWQTIWPYITKERITTKYGIKQPRLYDLGFPHNNCGGFCCRAGQGQFATLLMHFPERYLWHEERQEWAMSVIGPTAKPFLRVTIKGKLEYLTLRQFRLMIEAGALKPKMYEMGGCGCFVDDAI